MPLEQPAATIGRRRPSQPLAIGVWLLLAGASWYSLAAYGFKSDDGFATFGIQRWPVNSALPRSAGRLQLLVFIHPKCVCSQATITELYKLLATAQVDGAPLPRLIIVASIPNNAASRDWRNTSLIMRAAELPGAEVAFDAGGVEAQRFGIHASGTVLLFDAAGACLYAGGITPARGHEGANAGADSLAMLLRGDFAKVQPLPPLGCRLVIAGTANGGEQCLPSTDRPQ